MPYEPHRTILDREGEANLVAEYLGPQIDLFEQLVNYGTMLLVRLISTNRKPGIHDAIAVGVFLRQIVAMLDSFTILFKEGAGHAAYLPARSAFEASLFSEWILAEDLENRATYYYVACLRDERRWAQRGLQGNQEESGFVRMMRDAGIDIHAERPEADNQAQNLLQDVNRILAQPQLAPYDEHFERERRGRYDPYWYSLLDVRSIRALAVQSERLAEYEIFYSKAASIHHASRYQDHFRIADGAFHIESIRHLRFATEQVNFTGQLALRSYSAFLRHYRPDELPAFARTYQREWREAYLNVPHINYGQG